MRATLKVSSFLLFFLTVFSKSLCEESKEEDVDVVIVGSGIAGMTAAYELRKRDSSLDVRVLEANYRICGRLYSAPLKTANGTDRWDLGGQWVGHTQTHVLDLLNELNIPIYPQYVTGMDVGYGPSSPAVLRIFHILEERSLELTANDPFAHPMAQKWNILTLDDFVVENGGGPVERITTTFLTLSILNVESDDISLLYFLMYLNSQGSNLTIIEGQTGNGAVANRIFNGAATLCEAIQALLPEGAVSIYDPVTSIVEMPEHTQVITKNRRKLNARLGVVLAVPANLLLKIGFAPPLSDAKRSLLAEFYSKVSPQSYKFVITYPTSFWRDANFSGNMIVPVKCNTTSTPPVCLPFLIMFDGTTSKGSAALVGFAAFAETWLTLPQRKARVLAALAGSAFGPRTQTDAIAYADDQWLKETYARGCVPSIRPGIMNKDYPSLVRAPIGRLHFAGTYTATIWMGKMSGAVQSGQRVADEILGNHTTTTPTPHTTPNTSSAVNHKTYVYSTLVMLLVSCLSIIDL